MCGRVRACVCVLWCCGAVGLSLCRFSVILWFSVPTVYCSFCLKEEERVLALQCQGTQYTVIESTLSRSLLVAKSRASGMVRALN